MRIPPLLLAVWVLGFSLLLSPDADAATNPPPLPSRAVIRTNASSQRPPPAAKTNVVTAAKPAGGGTTNAAATKQPFLTKIKAQTTESFNRLRTTKAFYPVVIGVAVCLVFGGLFLAKFLKAKPRKSEAAPVARQAPSLAARPGKKAGKVHSCNILEVGPEARHLWQFEAQNGGFALNRQQTSLAGETLPSKVVAKNWRGLFQPKLNVAWLPAEQVFLRVAQFPRSDFNETLAMVELQLEKFSPMPVTQIVWSIQSLPHPDGNQQTVIVMIVAREAVEEFLGKLEGQGYLADRLELPLLDELQATPVTEDGAWIYPQNRGATNTAVVAWWYAGVLQNLDLVTLPEASQWDSLKEQLLQMAWAGEMEGWLKSSPRWHLVADATTTGQWEPALRQALDQPMTLAAPLPAPELAALTAKRAAHSDPRASLLPIEFSERYHQQFVDRLWMRGLLAVAGVYLLGVAVYGVALGFASFRTKAVENHVAQLGASFTNAVQLKAKYQVLKDRQELKFAALDCWNLIATYLPDSATLEGMNFNDGKRLVLFGTAPAEQRSEVIDFEGKLRRATSPTGDLMFDPNGGEHFNYTAQGGNMRWNFTLDLKRVEVD